MKSFKHIISYACDKNCSYCINEVLVHNEKQDKRIDKVRNKYREIADMGYDTVMLSGGEPVLNKMFEPCAKVARDIFDNVSVISAHINALSSKVVDKYVDDVLFSFHVEYLDNFENSVVGVKVPVYASMVVETYMDLIGKYDTSICYLLKDMGFSGLTLREKYPKGERLPGNIDTPCDFSLRVYERNNCVKDSLMLLPDLSTENQCDFS